MKTFTCAILLKIYLVVPKILSRYIKRVSYFGVEANDVPLNNKLELILNPQVEESYDSFDMFLQKEKIPDNDMLQICLDLAWWIMELHGNSSWKIFFSALDPSKIGIFKLNGRYFGYIKDYRMAQGIFQESG